MRSRTGSSVATIEPRRLAATMLALALALTPWGPAEASSHGTVTLSPTSASFTDTAERDAFSDVAGTITVTEDAVIVLAGPDGPAGPADGARGDATITYTEMATSQLGRMYLGVRDGGGPELLFAPDNDAVNDLVDGESVEVQFTFGAGSVFTVTAVGANDRPILTLAARDDITAALPGIGDDGFEACGTGAGVGWPYQMFHEGGFGSSPSGERCHFAFDGSAATKYLNFGQGGSGVLVDAADQYVVSGLHLTTANDSPERDPASFTLRGSNAGLAGPWTEITSGGLAPPFARFTDYPSASFGNAVPYRYYQLVFDTVRGPFANSMQVSRIRLSGAFGTAPPVFVVGGDPVAVEPTLGVWDDSAQLAGAVATLAAGSQPGDALTLDIDPATMGGITVSWDPATLRLTLAGAATPEQYEAALRAVRFSTTDGSLSARTVEWQVTDADGLSSVTDTSQVLVLSEAPPQPQTVTLPHPGDQVYGDGPITVDPSASGGGPVDVTSSTPDVCTVVGNEVTLVDVGTCTLTATAPAGGGFLEATTTQSFEVTPKPVPLTGWNVPARMYDASTEVTVEGTATIVGLVAGDDVTVVGPTSAAVASPNVGANLPVELVGVALTGPHAYRYVLQDPVLTTAITPRPLTVTGVQAVDRPYDGTRTVILSGATLEGVLVGDDVTLTGDTAGEATAADAGTHAVSTSMGLTGADAGNYTLTVPALQVTISKASATLEVIDGRRHVADGTSKTVTVRTSPTGLPGVHITYNGSTMPPSAPGTYRVRVWLDSPNHSAAPIEFDMVIAPAALSPGPPTTEADTRGRLPVTGGPTWLLTLTGLAALAVGTGARDIARRLAPRPG